MLPFEPGNPYFDKRRRRFLQASAGAIATFSLPSLSHSNQTKPYHLIASPATTPLVTDLGPATQVWAFNQQVPGPLLRYRQGEKLSLIVENQLPQQTTVHWHGLRIPIGMDGVPFLSQIPIAPGETFHYEFELKDAGTFWYHPHVASSEQVGRGLRGVLIVDEIEPIAVDRDIVWVLDDWRLDSQAQIVPFESNMRDASHNGRIGNVVTVNGDISENFDVAPGERLRLRLVNVANARTFALQFQGLKPWIIALDGHPLDPIHPENDLVVLGAGQRADLILDISGSPGDTSVVMDQAFRPNFDYELKRLVRTDQVHNLREFHPGRLTDNPVSLPNLASAERRSLVFEGGAMGSMTSANMNGEEQSIRDLVNMGKVWALNGMVPDDVHFDPPMFQLKLNQSYVFDIENRTAWEHPIHLHGHVFQIISRNGVRLQNPPVRDTVLMQPEERVEIAFVADNPGKWMFHCHVLEHQSAGMITVVEVA